MAEFIGSTISLVSKRDIRYVGTLVEINSENSTVALENVKSFGTEGRRPEEEIEPNETPYDFIVFRGSDVKDLRIDEAAVKKPESEEDPAIIQSQRRPHGQQPVSSSPAPGAQSQGPPPQQGGPHNQGPNRGPQHGQPDSQNHQPFPQHQQFPPPHYPYNMPPQGRGFPGPFPSGQQGFPPGPYGPPPPGWYPPYGMPPHMQGQFPPHQMPIGPPGQFNGPQGFPQRPPQPSEAAAEPQAVVDGKPAENKDTAAGPAKLEDAAVVVEKKPVAAAIEAAGNAKSGLTAGKNSRLIPAVPRSPLATKSTAPTNGVQKQSAQQPAAKPAATSKSVEEANRDARAAVAAAMAKLSGTTENKQVENGTTVDAITKGVSDIRTDTRGRGGRGHRGGYRGDRGGGHRVEVPNTDFDFESANAKFNKQDLVKEAIATGSPLGTPTAEESISNRASDAGQSITPSSGYNKSSSFFDDISSEIKDRAEGGGRGGREFRHEERAKNVETFGQGSVDNYRHNNRGRGRGRGYRGRGRGDYSRGDGRGRGRGDAANRGPAVVATTQG